MQLMSSRQVSRRSRWLRYAGLVGMAGLIVAAWLGYQPVLNRYHQWKQQRALAQARGFLEQKDFANAKLALDVALAAVPGDPNTLRVAANLLDSVGSPQVMPLRRRLVQLDPGSVNDRAALVMSALRFGDLNAARDALSELTPEQANQPVALKAALTYANATDNKPIADALLDRLQHQEPSNQNLQVLHALLRAQSPQPDIAGKARAELKELAQMPRNALFIHRELLVQAEAQRDFREALRLARLVAADPRATLQDRLQLANLQLNVEGASFASVFGEVAPLAKRNVTDAAELARWLIVVNRPQEALQWIDGLSGPMSADPKLVACRADALAALQQWDPLERMLNAGAWGTINRDTVQLAFAARVAHERQNEGLVHQLWDEALSAAGHSQADMNLLYRLAAIWRWNDQVERTLWAITKAAPNQVWAHKILFGIYRERKDTDNMRALMDTLRDGDPTLPRYKYDWALLSLLTFHSVGWTPPKQVMEGLYRADPANAFYATGYAFALAQSNKGKEAVAVVAKLPPVELNLPARAPYLAYIYGVGRQKVDFARFAALQPKLADLLPEESDLFELGRDALDRPVREKAPPPPGPRDRPKPPSDASDQPAAGT